MHLITEKLRIVSVCRYALLALLLFSGVIFAQDIRSSLFTEADQQLEAARKSRAEILAPQNFTKAMEYYREAEENLQQGKNLDDIRKKLRAASAYFSKAADATKLAEVTFVPTIKARADAKDAEAVTYATEQWTKAESKFAEAAGNLEDGDVNGARKRSGEAETLFREAELAAIKANYLKETWDLLGQADKMDVKDRAPKTLAKARRLVQEAEKELNENRYDTDVARGLAQQAKYEARHAIYLGQLFENMKKNKTTTEDLVLDWEKPLQQIAAAMEINGGFEGGYLETTQEILQNIREYQDNIQSLTQDLADRDQQISDLLARIAEMEGQLGAVAQQKSELQKRMERQAKIREQFQAVEEMFSREEARVLREGNDIILRLVGLNFASGKADIQPSQFSLLTKVQKAINTFPGSKLVVEGHTDSYGGDEFNLKLSQNRAEAVRQYLLANLAGFDGSEIESFGYGESKPIANNETKEGRLKNRRIDIVIKPNLIGMNQD